MQLHGVGETDKIEKTPAIQDNGFNPRFQTDDTTDGARFTFVVEDAETAMLGIRVWEVNKVEFNTLVGHACIPALHLRPGHRSIELYDLQNNKLPHASVLCRFSKHVIMA